MAPIEVTSLTKTYGSVVGIEDLSLTVREGEVFGFLGPNGAGKTTTIRTLMGFQSPTGGGATVLGYDITNEHDLIEMKRRVGYLSSDPAFDEGVTGRRYLSYHAALRGDERSDELLELFDPPMDREIREYSRGNKQKLAIVLAFMHDPDLLIMDEPTSGLDPLLQERFLEFVRAEQGRGKTFFFSSHILNEVQKVCDRVGIIRNGHLVEVEDVETLLHRGGKEVRVHVAEAVDKGEFAIDGAHEVEITGGGSSSPQPVETDGGERSDVEDNRRLPDHRKPSISGTSRTSDDERSEARPKGAPRNSERRWRGGEAASDRWRGDAAPRSREQSESSGSERESRQGAARSDGGDVPTEDSRQGTSVSFTYTGKFDVLLSHLLDYTIIDLDIEEAPLEDVFMRFYGEDDGSETNV